MGKEKMTTITKDAQLSGASGITEAIDDANNVGSISVAGSNNALTDLPRQTHPLIEEAITESEYENWTVPSRDTANAASDVLNIFLDKYHIDEDDILVHSSGEKLIIDTGYKNDTINWIIEYNCQIKYVVEDDGTHEITTKVCNDIRNLSSDLINKLKSKS